MSSLKKWLLAGTAACFLLGIVAVARAWRNPDVDGFPILATAGAWPWALGMVAGGFVWWRGRAVEATGLEHAVFVYAASGAAAAVLGALALSAANIELPASAHPPCGPLDPLCDAVTSMALACLMCVWTLGFVFPALLPPAAAVASSQLLGDESPSMPQLLAAITATTVCWLGVLLTGLVLAFA